MVEKAAVLAVVAVLSIGTYALFHSLESRTGGTRYQSELRQYASSLATYQQSRGYFPTDLKELSRLEPDVDFIPGGEALSEGQFAIDTASIGGVTVLGLATIGADGRCLTLTQPPLDSDAARASTASFLPSTTQPCSGAVALAQTGDTW